MVEEKEVTTKTVEVKSAKEAAQTMKTAVQEKPADAIIIVINKEEEK